MENHPIPQDVTGFKFKLIGSVTVKQFLYLMACGITCALIYWLPFHLILKFPLIGLFALIGIGLAFIPIDGRPMDVMIKNFLRALPAENQFIFRKRGADALLFEYFQPKVAAHTTEQTQNEKDEEKNSKRALLYSQLKMSSSYRPDASEQAILNNVNSYFGETAHNVMTAAPQRVDEYAAPVEKPEIQIVRPVIETPAPTKMASEFYNRADFVPVNTLVKAEKEKESKPEPPAASAPPAHEEATTKEETPSPLVASRPAPVVENALKPAAEGFVKPHENKVEKEEAENMEEATTAKFVTPESQVKAGFPEVPDTPNVVMGIVKDPRGRVIPNVLVEIIDQQQVPVRAFKTNALGQFAAATALADGTYTVLLEDPRKTNEFEQLSITLDGNIFQPLEIISMDQREKLRRELFQQPKGTITQGASNG